MEKREMSSYTIRWNDVEKMAPMFHGLDGCGLLGMPKEDQILWMKYIGLPASFIMPTSRLFQWGDWISKDNWVINKKGEENVFDLF